MQAADVMVDSRGGRIEVWPCGRPANGAHYRMELFLPIGARVSPEHFHPHQEERLEVVSGRLAVRLEGRLVRLGAGESLVIPPGVRHRLANDLDRETHIREEFVPGLEIHRFFAALFDIERSDRGLRRVARRAQLWSDEPEHIDFRLPSRLLVRLAGATVRPLRLATRR